MSKNSELNQIDLDEYRWKNRVVLIFAPSIEDNFYLKQKSEFEGKADELENRDIIIIELLKVTSTTISRQQYEWALKRVRELGLSEQVQILLKDYRDFKGIYDKLVSIEMIEAVGHQYLGRFLQCCGELLKPDGLMTLQAITITDQCNAITPVK